MDPLPTGVKDSQSVVAGGTRATAPVISGVRVHELRNVLTRSGWMAEVFRTDFPVVGVAPKHVIFVQLNPGAVTDWHRHGDGTDHLIGVGGNIKLALWDGRETSATRGQTDTIRFGAICPVLVVVPPGVWHGLRNESGVPAAYLNVTDRLYDHENPDNWRITPGTTDIPDVL